MKIKVLNLRPWHELKASDRLVCGSLLLILLAGVVQSITLLPQFSLDGGDFTGANTETGATIFSTQLKVEPALSQLSFGAAEAALTKVSRTTNKHLALNLQTATALESAVSHLPDPLSDQVLQRAQFLARKSTAGPAASDLEKLFSIYYRYKQAENSSLPPIDDVTTLATEVSRFEQQVLLRRRYFGEVSATQLFGQEETLASYLLNTRKVSENAKLSEDEKKTQLKALEQKFTDTYSNTYQNLNRPSN